MKDFNLCQDYDFLSWDIPFFATTTSFHEMNNPNPYIQNIKLHITLCLATPCTIQIPILMEEWPAPIFYVTTNENRQMGQFRLTFNEKTCGEVTEVHVDLEKKNNRITGRQLLFQLLETFLIPFFIENQIFRKYLSSFSY